MSRLFVALMTLSGCALDEIEEEDLSEVESEIRDGNLATQSLWEKAVRMQATLATRLRLSPHSRISPKTVARQQPRRGPWPWD